MKTCSSWHGTGRSCFREIPVTPPLMDRARKRIWIFKLFTAQKKKINGTLSVSVKQQWLLSYLKNVGYVSEPFWFNVWIGYAVKVSLLKQNFTARLDCFLKIHYSFDPPEPCPQQCTFGFALLFFLIAGCRLHRLTDRNVTAGFWWRHHIVDRAATRRYLIGFMALRHIYLMLAKWNFFAFMRLSKLSIHPGNNRTDFAISELLSNATRHPMVS